MKWKGKHFTVIKDSGIFKSGMRCYCFDEQSDFIRMWFQEPVVGEAQEVSVSKLLLHIFREG